MNGTTSAARRRCGAAARGRDDARLRRGLTGGCRHRVARGTHAWCDTTLSPDARAAVLNNALSDLQREEVISGDAVPKLDVPAQRFVDGAEGAPAGAAAMIRGTGLPSPSALGATFDPMLATLYGTTVGQEVDEHGYDGVWGPTLNLMRSPLAGRSNEYYSEDAMLDARTAVNWTLGAQQAGTMVQLKHFIGNDPGVARRRR